MGSWLHRLLTEVTSRRGTETKGPAGGTSLDDCLHCLRLLFHFLQVLRRQRLAYSQFPPEAWRDGQEAETGKPRILAKAEERGLYR